MLLGACGEDPSHLASPTSTVAGVAPEAEATSVPQLEAIDAPTTTMNDPSTETDGSDGVYHNEGSFFHVSDVEAPEWPFHGAITLDRGSSRLDFYDARDGSVTSIDLVGFTRPDFCSWSTMVWGEERVLVEVEGPHSYQDVIEIRWGESGSLMPKGSMIDWQEINSQTDHGRQVRAGESNVNVIRQFDGLTLQVDGVSGGYFVSRTAGTLGTVYTLEGDQLEGSAALDWVNEWTRRIVINPPNWNDDHAPLSWLLGTDGELVGLAFTRFEPACVRPKLFLVSMRTGELLACSEEDLTEIMLVYPRDQDLMVEQVRLPSSGWLNGASSPCVGNSGIELGSIYGTAGDHG